MKLLGKTDLSVSPVALGAASFGSGLDEEQSFSVLDAYVSGGGNFIDTANAYGLWGKNHRNESEIVLSKWLKQRKHDVLIATKGGHRLPGTDHYEMRLSRSDIESDIDMSLATLGTRHIDLYYLHRDDTRREIGEIIETMESFVRMGKIRYYGASNYSAERLSAAEAYAAEHGYRGFSAVSNQYSAATVNRGVGMNTNPDPTLVITGEDEWKYHTESQMPLVAFEGTARGYFSKLASGAELPQNVARAYDNEESRRTLREIVRFAEENNCSVQTGAIVFCAKAPFQLIPITSAKNVAQCADIVRAIELLSDNEK